MSNRIFLAVGTLFVLSNITLSQMQAASDAANTIRDLDFNSPTDDTSGLSKPFLVEYDNTTSVV
jgi:hypothetical protein